MEAAAAICSVLFALALSVALVVGIIIALTNGIAFAKLPPTSRWRATATGDFALSCCRHRRRCCHCRRAAAKLPPKSHCCAAATAAASALLQPRCRRMLYAHPQLFKVFKHLIYV